jgi:hypothetical protein
MPRVSEKLAYVMGSQAKIRLECRFATPSVFNLGWNIMFMKTPNQQSHRCVEIRLTPPVFVVALALAILVGSAAGRDVPRADRAANAAARGIHGEANRILESIRTTKYQHRTEIDEKKREYLCDCSGFVGYVLNRSVGADGSGALGDGRKRPLAMDYEKFFAAAPTKAPSPYHLPKGEGDKGTLPKRLPKGEGFARWQRIERLADARPGDIIAWRHEKPKPGNTGHVIIVDQRPGLEDDGLVRVVFIDSTTRPMANDTRAKGTSGIGRGTMWFKIDEQGRAIAHVRGARGTKPTTEKISIGRALPAVKKKAASRRAA